MSLRKPIALLALALSVFPGRTEAAQTVTRPFEGVSHTDRSESAPRPLRLHVVDVDLAARGIRFKVTPPRGAMETTKQTTLQFLTEQRAQIAINAHFFEPWPPPDPDGGTADLVGIAASDGRVYSPFEAGPPKAYAIRPNAPGLNIDPANHAVIVHRNPSDPSGLTATEPVRLYNTVTGSEQIIADGVVTVTESDWNNRLSPRTAIGLTADNHLILFAVDGRQPGISEGMTVREAAEWLRQDYRVVNALNLDGGGSTTLAMADPTPRIVNVPVGVKDVPGSERPVGSNLAVLAQPLQPETSAPVWPALLLSAVAAALVAERLRRRHKRTA